MRALRQARDAFWPGIGVVRLRSAVHSDGTEQAFCFAGLSRLLDEAAPVASKKMTARAVRGSR